MTEFKTQPLIGKRIIAGLIDYAIIYGFLIIFILIFGEPNETGEYSVNGNKSIVPVLFWAIMTIGIEQLIGETLGNSLVDLKPISMRQNINSNFKGSNTKPTFGQSFKRHLLDPIDMFLFGLIGILTIKNSEKNQRLGDMWAKTIVVKTSDLKQAE
jgi:uncharacterized RDD family membrane protein YckC